MTRASLLRDGLRFTQALQAGTTRWILDSQGKVLGRAERVLTAPGTIKLTLKLSVSGRRALRRERPARLTLRTHDVASALDAQLPCASLASTKLQLPDAWTLPKWRP